MNKEKRIKEIESSFTSFTKEKYRKSEFLDELLKLQRECVEMAYPEMTEEEVAHMHFKSVIWKLGSQCNGLEEATIKDFDRFKHECWRANNMICSEIAGAVGEKKAFMRLVEAGCKGAIIRNLELSDEISHGELDLVVLDPRAAFIVEVKNINQEVFIDEVGNFYCDGQRMRKLGNLQTKMARKERLLRGVLDAGGFNDLPIESVIVFANDRYSAINHCKEIATCKLGKLPFLIGEHVGRVYLDDEREGQLKEYLLEQNSHESYASPLNSDLIKNAFACTLAAIEENQEREANQSAFGSVVHWLISKLANQEKAVA